MKLYELSCLISPEISQEQLESLRREIRALIENEGGILDINTASTQKHLAYPIKNRSLANLEVINFYTEGSQLPNLTQKLKAKEHALRFLLTQKRVSKSRSTSIPQLAPSEKRPNAVPQKSKESKVELEKIEEKLEELLGS